MINLEIKAVKNIELIDNRCRISFSQGKEKLDFVLTYTTNYSSTIVPYVNTGLTEKGPHIVAIKTLLTREFNKFFREKGWIKEKEENLTGDDVQEGMYIVFNITAPGVGYDAQVKSTITQIDMSNFTSALAEEEQEKQLKKQEIMQEILNKKESLNLLTCQQSWLMRGVKIEVNANFISQRAILLRMV